MRRWYLLLAVPFLSLLYPPLYATEDPELLGFPFFYWYQFAWVPLTAGLTYFVETREPPPPVGAGVT
jgi:1-acyl-sn-glycerol-3-phosphate acyltransferase